MDLEDEYNQQIDNIIHNSENLLYQSGPREDLRHLRTYTVDDRDTLEVDDAISLEKEGEDSVIWIHIADPATFIDYRSPIDNQAKTRSTTLYLTSETRYMLPIRLVRELISLDIGRVSPAISSRITVSDTGEIKDYLIVKSIIKPNYRLDYEEADELIDYAPKEELDLHILSKIFERLRNFRRKNGAVILEQTQGKFFFIGKKLSIRFIDQSPSRRLVTESMILMGNVIGLFGSDQQLALPYRTQSGDLKRSQDIPASQNQGPVENFNVRKHLAKASVSTTPKPHRTLGVDLYVQGSSPIRRYSDLIVHRQIHNVLNHQIPISRIELESELKVVEVNTKNSSEIVKQDLLNSQHMWFSLHREIAWKVFFLKCMNTKKQIALVHFSQLSMDILCKLEHITYMKTGDLLSLKFKRLEIEDQILEFVTI